MTTMNDFLRNLAKPRRSIDLHATTAGGMNEAIRRAAGAPPQPEPTKESDE